MELVSYIFNIIVSHISSYSSSWYLHDSVVYRLLSCFKIKDDENGGFILIDTSLQLALNSFTLCFFNNLYHSFEKTLLGLCGSGDEISNWYYNFHYVVSSSCIPQRLVFHTLKSTSPLYQTIPLTTHFLLYWIPLKYCYTT